MTGTVACVPDRLLDDLDPHQRAAVTEKHVPLAILAPAGSGKTRVLTRRIAWRVREELADARHVLAVTFTRRAAGELVDRLDALGVDSAVTAGTFHALALAQLRRRAAEDRRELPRVLDRKARVLAPLLGKSGAQGALAISDVAAEIEWAKARMIPPERYAAAARAAERRLPRSPAELADLYSRYEAEKRKQRWLDFDDLLGWCADAIERDAEFAAAQRWRFRHLFVDEFQDATPLQIRLLRVARRPTRSLRRRRRRTGDLRVRGRRRVAARRLRAALPRWPHRRAHLQLPLDRRDRRGRGGRARAGVRGRARRAARGTPRRPSSRDPRVR